MASSEVTQDPTDKHQLRSMSQQARTDLSMGADAQLKASADKG
ncbi:MAG: hypothetical protein AAF585_04135 [Verrucomicrobiota bacterium]